MNRENGMDSKREEFEKWYERKHLWPALRCMYDKSREYEAETAQRAWEVWQAALASLQPAQEPVYYSITVNGQHCGNFWPILKDAEAAAKRLNASYPQDRREVVPLYAPLPQSALSTDAQKVRDQALEEAAKVCDAADKSTHPADLVDAIRALQSQPAGKDAEDAIRDIAAERRRQVEAEGWTPSHDDQHSDGQMAVAAGYYALACGYPHERDIGHGHIPPYWPWDAQWWKPKDRRSNLIRAAALIVAEIERLDRAAIAQKENDRG